VSGPAAATCAPERQLLRVAAHGGAQLSADTWRYRAELPEQSIAGASVVLSLAELSASPETGAARLGVRLGPADAIEALAAYLPGLALIAIEFAGPGEGRGYSAARLLRQRYGFTGEIRAVGAVKQDQLFLMWRAGFDAFELAPTERAHEALAALQRYAVAYQPGAPAVPLRAQRFFTQRSGSVTSANS